MGYSVMSGVSFLQVATIFIIKWFAEREDQKTKEQNEEIGSEDEHEQGQEQMHTTFIRETPKI
jgi:hypothetical protein